MVPLRLITFLAALLVALGEVPSKCETEFAEYAGCSTSNALFAACSQPAFLNDTQVQQQLGCYNNTDPMLNLGQCQKLCNNLIAGLTGVPNDECPAQMQFMQAFSGQVQWMTYKTFDQTLKMNVSSILPIPNLISGYGIGISDMGNPQKCVGVKGARFCVVSALISAIPGLLSPVQLGLCLPHSCDQAALTKLVMQFLGAQYKGMTTTIECDLIQAVAVQPPRVDGQLHSSAVPSLPWSPTPVAYPSKFPWKWQAMVVISLCMLLVGIVGAATMLECWHIRKHRKIVEAASDRRLLESSEMVEDAEASTQSTPRGLWQGLFNDFSLIKNGRALLKVRAPERNTFSCLDAIRVLSMAWVVLGHTFFYPSVSIGFSNYEQTSPPNGAISDWGFQLIPGGFYAVDTFLWLSGFLCAVSLKKRAFSGPENSTCKRFGMLYPLFMLSRYLRLLPVEMFCIMFCSNVLVHMGRGIFWGLNNGICMAAATGPDCGSDWWANALFIQNFYPSWPDKINQCFGHTWYLAVDMQLYLITPFFSLAYGKRECVGWIFLLLALAASIGLNVYVPIAKDIVPSPLFGMQSFMGEYYSAPWIRAEPFLVGIAFAWIWASSLKNKQPNKMLSLVLIALCLFLVFCCVFWGPHMVADCDSSDCTNIKTHPAGETTLVVWGSMNRLTWGFLLSLMSFLCFHGRFIPVVQDALALEFWQPLAKLCYSVYLIHPMWLVLYYCQHNTQLEYDIVTLLFDYVSILTMASISALFLYLFVESPCANLQGKLLGGATPA